MVAVGSVAPDFTLKNQNGEDITLSDYRGKKVILFSFPKAHTAGCTAQVCSFRDAFPRMETANAVVFGISGDSVEQQKSFHDKYNLQYDLLSDPGLEVLKTWDAGISVFGLSIPLAQRSYWVLDEEGQVIAMQVGIGPEASMEAALQAVQG
ncbi:MAG: peroxiredoxin [Anaerolineae bacterium]|nr:peroxiredoxin [Anaerolineae bacterium]